MWANFFAAGGWGMYPVSLIGFFLIASSVLFALRPSAASGRTLLSLGILTLMSGVLGATVGICNSAHYIPQVAAPRQLSILALGVEESLHNVVLALILVMVAGLVSIIGTLRRTPAALAPATTG